jgi:eukaryotic-like serine/threonine-protein kinase
MADDWTVPGYTELKPLGSGGFGSVMLARHDATGTAVAIKYLLPGLRADPDFAALFRSEAQALGALDDPHVVRLYEYVESPLGAAIVMELIDGVTLADIVSQHGKTTPEAALVVLYGALLGLAAAHARGVVHRDFKPGNVLVNARGASKLTDFGIAARAGTPTIPSGSVAYAPPEQFDGGPASPAADVYAATATFYECLAGRPPFAGPTSEAVIWQHQSADVPMDPVPEPLQPIVARGLAKDPRYRPSDAAALAVGLRAAAGAAYGPDWEQRGYWYLGASALALAALWPSAGVPALHVASVQQVDLSHGAHQAQAAHHQASQAELHRWHLRHVLHQRHLTHLRAVRAARSATRAASHLRNIAAVVTTGAVMAAGVTVAATSRPPGGPGTAAQPAAATYRLSPAPASPTGTLSLTLAGIANPIGRTVYVAYGLPNSAAALEGEVANSVPGEVVRLYARQFPYSSPPVAVQSVTLKQASGSPYQFLVAPTVATRYQVMLLRSASATTPLAVSASKTVYTIGYTKYTVGSLRCTGVPVMDCTQTIGITVYFPPSEIAAAMSKPTHLYMALKTSGSPLTSLQLDSAASLSSPQRIADNAYTMTATFPEQLKIGDFPQFGFCTVLTESSDGLGLPDEAACGQKSIAVADVSAWGGSGPA